MEQITQNPGTAGGVAAIAVLLLVGGINYFRAYRSANGKTKPPDPAAKQPKTKRDTLLPGGYLLLGLLLSAAPFILRYANIQYHFSLSQLLGLSEGLDDYGAVMSEYRVTMLIFVLSSAVASLLLFTAFYRQGKRKGRGFFKSLLIYCVTYGVATTLLDAACTKIGEDIFGSADSGPMLYGWIVYLYLIFWSLADGIKQRSKSK